VGIERLQMKGLIAAPKRSEDGACELTSKYYPVMIPGSATV
jgi:hypothetical protein